MVDRVFRNVVSRETEARRPVGSDNVCDTVEYLSEEHNETNTFGSGVYPRSKSINSEVHATGDEYRKHNHDTSELRVELATGGCGTEDERASIPHREEKRDRSNSSKCGRVSIKDPLPREHDGEQECAKRNEKDHAVDDRADDERVKRISDTGGDGGVGRVLDNSKRTPEDHEWHKRKEESAIMTDVKLSEQEQHASEHEDEDDCIASLRDERIPRFGDDLPGRYRLGARILAEEVYRFTLSDSTGGVMRICVDGAPKILLDEPIVHQSRKDEHTADQHGDSESSSKQPGLPGAHRQIELFGFY